MAMAAEVPSIHSAGAETVQPIDKTLSDDTSHALRGRADAGAGA